MKQITLNSGIFDKRDDLAELYCKDDLGGRLDLEKTASEQKKGRQQRWFWRQQQWQKVVDLGSGHVFVFQQGGRRRGSTHMAKHIACKAVDLHKYKVMTVHTGTRTMNAFKKLCGKTASFFDSTCTPRYIPIELYDVIVVDHADHVMDPYVLREFCKAAKDAKCTVFLTCQKWPVEACDSVDYLGTDEGMPMVTWGDCMK